MRGLTSTLLLVVVLGGLVGYIYFVDAERDPAAAEAKPKAFGELSADSIDEVQIRSGDGGAARVQRVGDGWQLVEPDKADADTGVVGSVTSSLASLEVQRVVDENPADLAQYGLNPARIEVAFRLKDQKDFQRLLVGEKTPTGGDLFAKRPDETRVFLVSSFLDATFNKTAFDFRDKAILKFQQDQTDGIEVVDGSTTLQFAKSGTDWRIVKPVAVRADYAAVEGLISRLSSAQMQKIVAPDAGDLKAHGLDRPALSATITSASAKATLLIGRADAGSRLAKDAARPEVFAVEESLFTELAKDLPDYRRKELFDARSFTATRIETRRGAETLAFEKSTDGKETWKNATGQNVDTAKVEDLLTKLSNIRAQSFQNTAPASLTMPALTAIVRFDDTKTETVTFGRSGTDVFAGRTDEPGAATIDAMMFDEAVKALDALK